LNKKNNLRFTELGGERTKKADVVAGRKGRKKKRDGPRLSFFLLTTRKKKVGGTGAEQKKGRSTYNDFFTLCGRGEKGKRPRPEEGREKVRCSSSY